MPTIPDGCPLPMPGYLLVEIINPTAVGGIIIPDSATPPERFKFIYLAGDHPDKAFTAGDEYTAGDELYATSGLPIKMPHFEHPHQEAMFLQSAGDRKFLFVKNENVIGYYRQP